MFDFMGDWADLNHDGEVDTFEAMVGLAEMERMDSVMSETDCDDDEEDELISDLEMAGLDYDELSYMDEDERRETIEEAALSPTRLMRLMCYIHDLTNMDSQFIISTHSPILMTFPGAEILEITESGIKSVDYRDTEHFMITKRFMDAPEQMVKNLLEL